MTYFENLIIIVIVSVSTSLFAFWIQNKYNRRKKEDRIQK